MSPAAAQLVAEIRSLFVGVGEPAHDSWYFHEGRSGVAHDELVRLRLIMKVFGTRRGFAWRLTDAGAEVMQLRRTE